MTIISTKKSYRIAIPVFLGMTVLAVVIAIILLYPSRNDTPRILTDVTIPREFSLDNETIELAWTDDNTDEQLIIQTDKKTYYGFDQAEVYFSVTNITDTDQETDVIF